MFVTLMLGDFLFGASTLSVANFKKNRQWNVAEISRALSPQALQFCSAKAQTFSLDGTLFPGMFTLSAQKDEQTAIGTTPLKNLRDMADTGESFWLVSGNGDVLGKFAIRGISETETRWLEEGTPLRVDFSVELVEDFTDAGSANDVATKVLNLNANARQERADAFLSNYKAAEEDNPSEQTTFEDQTGDELPSEETEDIFSDPPAIGKWYLTKSGDTLSALCASAYPSDVVAGVAQVLNENAGLSSQFEPYDAGITIFFPETTNTQSSLTTGLFESTFLSRLI